MKTLLTAEWTNLAVATFETDHQTLAPYIPYKTELNDWNGKYYLSLLGFRFSNPVIAGIPSPFYKSFDEVNLRFYIRYKKDHRWKQGVVFIKEIAPSRMIGLAARWLYRENFIALPMCHHFDTGMHEIKTEYYWKIEKEWNHLKLGTSLLPEEPAPGSLESYIRDNYTACTFHTSRKTKEFDIEHRHWNIYPGISCDLSLDTEKIYGPAFSSCFQQRPAAYFGMDGSLTKVSYPVILE